VSGTSGSSGVSGVNGGDGASSTYNPQYYDGSSNVKFSSNIYAGGNYWMTAPSGTGNRVNSTFSSSLGGTYNTLSGYASVILGGPNNHVYGAYGSIGGGGSNTACIYGVVHGGSYNTASGYSSSVIGGFFSQAYASYSIALGSYVSNNIAYSTAAYYISKDAGSFRINHPDPEKMDTHLLYHSFVESPTAGDNIYRYEIETCNCQASLELPNYYKFLNKNDQVWVTPVNHFGNAYGIVDETQSCVSFCSDKDGKYMALIIGTRKDQHAENYWNGVERIKGTMTHSPDTALN